MIQRLCKILAITLLASPLPSQARESFGGGSSESIQSRPTCNGWHNKWCQNRYHGIIVDLRDRQLVEVEARAKALPSEIQLHKDRYQSLLNEIDRTNVQLSTASHPNNLATMIENLKVLITLTRDQGEAVKSIAEESRGAIADLVYRIQSYLKSTTTFAEDQLKKIELQLTNSENTAPQMQALLIEYRIYTEILRLNKTNQVEVEFKERCLQQSEDNPLLSKLQPETQALINEAVRANNHYESSEATINNILVRFSQIEQSFVVILAEFETQLESQKRDQSTYSQTLQSLENQKRDVKRTIANLERELKLSPNRISSLNAKITRNDLYWNCCDNLPYCNLLPDQQQEQDKYRAFERAINSKSAQAESCRKSGDL